MIRINLVAEGRKTVAPRAASGPGLPLDSENIAVWSLLSVVVLGTVVYAGCWFFLQRDIKSRTARVAEAQKQVDELRSILEEVDTYTKRREQLRHKIEMIGDLRDNQRGPVQIMDQVSRALPDLIWLEDLALTAREVTIEGRAFTTNAVASFIENLDRVPEFQEPVLRETKWDGQVYKYQIAFDYKSVPIRAVHDATGGQPVAR